MNGLLQEILYIKGRAGTRVVRDGPALRIKTQHNSDSIVPFRRIYQVHSFGCVEWQTEALLGCADHQIQILFSRQNGELRASLHSEASTTRHVDVSQNLNQCLNSQEGADIFKRWLKRRQQIARQQSNDSIRQQFSLSLNQSILHNRQKIATKYLCYSDWKKCQKLMLAHISADISQQLLLQNIDPYEMPLLVIHQINLLAEISGIVQILLTPALLLRVTKLKKLNRRSIRSSIDIFNQTIQWHQLLKPRISRQIDNFIIHMHRLLLETLNAKECR